MNIFTRFFRRDRTQIIRALRSFGQKSSVIGLLLCFASESCSKEETISIPDRLTGSEWTAWNDENTAVLKFASDTRCIYTELAGEEAVREVHYEYRYTKPDLYLASEDALPAKVHGTIEQADKKSIALQLYAEDGTVFFVAYKSVYFQSR